MHLDEVSILRSLDDLRSEELIIKLEGAGLRVPKYEEGIIKALHLSNSETAVMMVLMLRGEQTLGEIRSRSNRVYDFETIQEVEDAIDRLMNREEPLVVKLPKTTGRKENRFMHLISGDIDLSEYEQHVDNEKVRATIITENEQIHALEEKVTSLEERTKKLEEMFEIFKAQFE